MTLQQSRIFYLLAIFCTLLLLAPYPGTVFLACCFSCLTIPLFRHFCYLAHRIERKKPHLSAFRLRLLHSFPLLGYGSIIVLAIILPIFIFVLLVAPQASKGLAMLKAIDLGQKVQFLLPENINKFINTHLPSLADYPQLEAIVNELTAKAENIFSLGGELLNPQFLWGRTVAFLGGTMSVVWVFCLFLILTILFTVYAKEFKTVTRRLLQLPQPMLDRFVLAIRRAVSAILLGIIFVALLQGFFCGIGFAVAGIESPAFFGLLAAFVAPIPMVGTMLIWGPLALLLWFKGAHFAAVGLVLWGVLVISNIDSVIRPLFLRHGINAPFFVLILVMICGMGVFGPIGLIAAPVLFAFSLQLFKEANSYFESFDIIDKRF